MPSDQTPEVELRRHLSLLELDLQPAHQVQTRSPELVLLGLGHSVPLPTARLQPVQKSVQVVQWLAKFVSVLG